MIKDNYEEKCCKKYKKWKEKYMSSKNSYIYTDTLVEIHQLLNSVIKKSITWKDFWNDYLKNLRFPK